MTPLALKTIRTYLKLTQKELAENMKKSERVIQRWENGEDPIPYLAEYWLKDQIIKK